MNAHYDVVVVGSGFGGSIAALRCTEAGRSVLVLERGRAWPAETFPRDVTRIEDLFWDYPRRAIHRGLYELRFMSGVGTVVASGVGGGSLVYANIHITPDHSVFDDPRWPSALNLDTLAPYYQRVADKLSVAPLPSRIVLRKRDALRQAAAACGREIFDPPQAVTWPAGAVAAEGECALCAQCEFGCRLGAKHTMDRTYLAQAVQGGAELRAQSLVEAIEPSNSGYQVRFVDTVSGDMGVVMGKRVVVAAGTLGTNALLLACRDRYRTLPQLSSLLGVGYSANGDFLGSLQNAAEPLEPWRGPDVTSVIRYADGESRFTLAAPSFNESVMRFLASLGQPGPGFTFRMDWPWQRLGRMIEFGFKHRWFSEPIRLPGPGAGPAERMTNLFTIGRDNANGRIVLTDDGIDIHWDFAAENAALIEAMERAMAEIAQAYGATYAPLATWPLFRRPLTVHSLGGCRVADDPEHGVVSIAGEAFGYPGLFVADGSVIPTAIGYHPVMTICALAERIAEHAAQ